MICTNYWCIMVYPSPPGEAGLAEQNQLMSKFHRIGALDRRWGHVESFLLQFFHLFRILERRTSKAQNILEMIFSKKHRFLKAVKADSRPQTMDGELRGLRGNRKNRDTFQAGELYLHLVPCFFQKAPFFLGIFLIFQPRLTPEGILAATFQQL